MVLELLLVILGLGSGAVCADNREKVYLCGASDSCKLTYPLFLRVDSNEAA